MQEEILSKLNLMTDSNQSGRADTKVGTGAPGGATGGAPNLQVVQVATKVRSAINIDVQLHRLK
jgi:hypothetical protein